MRIAATDGGFWEWVGPRWCCWQFDVFATGVKRLLPRAHETVSEKFALLLCHALLLPAPQEREVKLKMFS